MVSAQRNLFLCFWQRVGFLRGREENNLLVHACGTNYLFLFYFFLCFQFFLLSLLFLLLFLVIPCFYFVIFKFSILSSSSPSLLLLYTARASFYSAYRDWILLFQPLTAFVWSGYTCRPPHLCVTPHHQTKRTILFVSLPWHPLPATVQVHSLSLSLMACTQWSISTLPVWVVCHLSRTLLPKEPWQEPQNRSSPLSTTKSCPLTSDP